MKKHFLGIRKDNDISYDMALLQAQISSASKATVESTGIEDLTQFISLALHPVSWLHCIIIVAVVIGIILLHIFPVTY